MRSIPGNDNQQRSDRATEGAKTKLGKCVCDFDAPPFDNFPSDRRASILPLAPCPSDRPGVAENRHRRSAVDNQVCRVAEGMAKPKGANVPVLLLATTVAIPITSPLAFTTGAPLMPRSSGKLTISASIGERTTALTIPCPTKRVLPSTIRPTANTCCPTSGAVDAKGRAV